MILISGLNGFIGSNLSRSLSSNNVRGFDRAKNVSEQFRNIECVIHLAGKAHDLKNVLNPDDYYKGNYLLTKSLYDAFLESSAKKFIFISSVKAVKDKVFFQLNELVEATPTTHYGKSKLMAEQYIQSKKQVKGKSYIILRPAMVHGAGNKGNLNLLFNAAKFRMPWPLGSFTNERSFCSVDNFVFVIKQILEKNDFPQGVYNLADDEGLSPLIVYRLICKEIGYRPVVLKIPPPVVWLIGRFGDFLMLPFNSERIEKLTEDYLVDNSKLTDALGCRMPLTSEEGLTRTIKSFLNV